MTSTTTARSSRRSTRSCTVDLSAFYSRRLERPAVHVRRWIARTPIRADSHVCHDGRLGAPAGADSAVHGRAIVALSAPARNARNRCIWRSSRPAADVEPLVDRELLDAWERLLRYPDDSQRVARTACAKTSRSATSLQAKVIVSAAGNDLVLLQRYHAQLPMLFIVSEVAVELHGDDLR